MNIFLKVGEQPVTMKSGATWCLVSHHHTPLQLVSCLATCRPKSHTQNINPPAAKSTDNRPGRKDLGWPEHT
jgi:hypothetical protein